MSENRLYGGNDGTGYFKVGITSDPAKRLKQIRTGNPTFTFLWCFECEKPQVLELEFHTKFTDKRVSGEGFDLIPEDLEFILNKFIPGANFDYFDTWNRIANKKIALNKEHIDGINEYWFGFRKPT